MILKWFRIRRDVVRIGKFMILKWFRIRRDVVLIGKFGSASNEILNGIRFRKIRRIKNFFFRNSFHFNLKGKLISLQDLRFFESPYF